MTQGAMGSKVSRTHCARRACATRTPRVRFVISYRAMPSRRELIERVTARMRQRGGEGRVEASLCFLRALLVGVGDDQHVPDEMLERVSEFLRIEPQELEVEPPHRRSSLRISTVPPARMTRVLFLGRSDPMRLPMFDAVGGARFSGIAEVRAAAIAPVAIDARAIKVLRHAGIETDHLAARSVSVDDLAWADIVVTFEGTREEWERFIPRSIAHEHHPVIDPMTEIDSLDEKADALDTLRYTLRSVERVIAAVRPARPSRFPAPAPLPPMSPSSGRLPTMPPPPASEDDD